MELVILALAWMIYFLLHSLLATAGIKNFFSRKLGVNFRYYRLAYVIFSTVGLLLLLFMNANIPSRLFINNEGVIRYLSLVFAALGVIIIKGAFRTYDFGSFIGLKDEDDPFLTAGILGSVRHPIYSGTILIVIGYWLFSPNLPTLISALCTFAYLPIGIYLEEKKLIEKFGERYLEYKRKVPAVFPKLF